jgi:hypothetical protein
MSRGNVEVLDMREGFGSRSCQGPTLNIQGRQGGTWLCPRALGVPNWLRFRS